MALLTSYSRCQMTLRAITKSIYFVLLQSALVRRSSSVKTSNQKPVCSQSPHESRHVGQFPCSLLRPKRAYMFWAYARCHGPRMRNLYFFRTHNFETFLSSYFFPVDHGEKISLLFYLLGSWYNAILILSRTVNSQEINVMPNRTTWERHKHFRKLACFGVSIFLRSIFCPSCCYFCNLFFGFSQSFSL